MFSCKLPLVTWLCLFACGFSFDMCEAVIYSLNESEYARFPPVFHVDPFEECMQDPAGVYCATKYVLVSDEPSPLLQLIEEYSAATKVHYNHSLLRHNICVTNACKKFYTPSTKQDLVGVLEACLNETMFKSYGLKTKVLEQEVHCQEANNETQVEVLDVCTFAILAGILAMNIIGSLYDICFTNGKKGEGNIILTSFSMRRNLKKLVSSEISDPRLERLKCLNGIKGLSSVSVLIAHCILAPIFFVKNTLFVENIPNRPEMHFITSYTVVVHNFFLTSGLLLAYHLERMREKPGFKINWFLLPKVTLLRWIRLTPLYAILLLYSSSAQKFVFTGPHAYLASTAETADCRAAWWQHLLYVNNYNDRSHCMLHTWYLAADTQLFVLGLIVCIVCQTSSSRKVVLPILLVVAMVIPAAHTYWQDLDGILIPSLEGVTNMFRHEETFTHVYKRGHTNMFAYMLGVGLGWLIYHLQARNFDLRKYKHFLPVYYLLVPAGVAVVAAGMTLQGGARAPLARRLLFAALHKPLWAMIIAAGVLCWVFKMEDRLRGLVEWRGWAAAARLSYAAYLLHVLLLKWYAVTHYTDQVDDIYIIKTILWITAQSFVAAIPAWLLVEQPLGRILTSYMTKHHHKDKLQ